MQTKNKWNHANHIETSADVQAIADKHSAGRVQARYLRRGQEVLLLFPYTELYTASTMLVELKLQAGERNSEKIIKNRIDDIMFVHMPAQVYVDKFGGDVPGFKREQAC